jgi:hypothetical protein
LTATTANVAEITLNRLSERVSPVKMRSGQVACSALPTLIDTVRVPVPDDRADAPLPLGDHRGDLLVGVGHRPHSIAVVRLGDATRVTVAHLPEPERMLNGKVGGHTFVHDTCRSRTRAQRQWFRCSRNPYHICRFRILPGSIAA